MDIPMSMDVQMSDSTLINPAGGLTSHAQSAVAFGLAMAEDYIAGQTENVWKDCVKERENGILLLSGPVTALHPYLRGRILYRAIKTAAKTAKDIGGIHVDKLEQLFAMQCGKQADLAYGVVAERVYEGVILHDIRRKDRDSADMTAGKEAFTPVRLVVPGSTYAPGYGTFLTKVINRVNFAKIPKDGYTKWFDYDKIKGDVCIRTRTEGDYFSINTSGNTQKLKSYLVNEKIPRNERDSLLLLADGNHIIWIPGYRCSHEYYINDKTKKILEIQYTENG